MPGTINEDMQEAARLYVALAGGQGAPSTGPTGIGKVEDAPHASGDVGTMGLAVRNDALNTSLSSANGDYTPFAVDSKGAQFVKKANAGTAGTPVSIVLAANTNQQIVAGNLNRRGLMIVNRSGQEVFLRFGGGAATTSLFSWVLAAGEKYELPFEINAAVQAISTVAGSAPGLLITEFTD